MGQLKETRPDLREETRSQSIGRFTVANRKAEHSRCKAEHPRWETFFRGQDTLLLAQFEPCNFHFDQVSLVKVTLLETLDLKRGLSFDLQIVRSKSHESFFVNKIKFRPELLYRMASYICLNHSFSL